MLKTILKITATASMFTLICTLLLGASNLSNKSEKKDIQPITTITTSADFNVNYDSYEKIIANAEVIAYGQVEEVEPFLGAGESVYSRIKFKTKDVLKGKTDSDTLSLVVEGGIMPLAEYLELRSERMKAKLTLEVYEQMLEEAKLSNELLTSSFCGVKNMNVGDSLLLFLTKSFDNDNEYYITGTSYFGKFEYDERNGTFFREMADGNGTAYPKSMRKELLINLNDLAETISNTKDASVELRNETYNKIQRLSN